MGSEKKTIGVCLTKIHDRMRSEFTDRLFDYARKNGFNIIVYNSFVDFYNTSKYLSGSTSVYDTIDYSIIDVLVILTETIFDKSIVERTIAKAKSKNVPVVLIKGEAEGCWTIRDDYANSYKSVIRHVICEHNVIDTFFIAGKKENDINSEKRLGCYKSVLEECGIPFSDEKVAYGDYWYGPTYAIIDRLSESGKMPQAIFCANDSMAIAACERLSRHGYKVPDDVIVTGFDGLPQADYFVPSITTCKEDAKAIAEVTGSVISDILNGSTKPETVMCEYEEHIGESCGCKTKTLTADRSFVAEMCERIDEMNSHEDFIYSKIDRILDKPSLSQAIKILSYLLLGGSYMFLDNNLLSTFAEVSSEDIHFDGNYTMVVHSDTIDTDSDPCVPLTVLGVREKVRELLGHDNVLIISPIFIETRVYGYYCAGVSDVSDFAHRIKRITKAINISISDMYNRSRNIIMEREAEKAAYTNSVTKLPNLRGMTKWFNEFSADKNNKAKSLLVSLCSIAKFNQIYENYDIADAEDVQRFVAESLVASNPADAHIGHISESEFVIIRSFEKESEVRKAIDSTIENFSSLLDDYNASNNKGYFVEINSGSTILGRNWSGTLTSFIKFASGEMYMKALLREDGGKNDDEVNVRYDEKKFSFLIDNNMFRYCFQPIVDARTGEIYAYEALMRTDECISMSPIDVLNAAAQYGRLYDIERATVFNVMENYVRRLDEFKDRRIFINLIPGYFLNDSDYHVIGKKYGAYMNNFVFELTERNTVTDDEYARIKKLGGSERSNDVAVDDYGTGHSNIVNLIRYSPQIIKIDRFLIMNVDKDVNKQMFIKSTIDFARLNGIKVLAEGVETTEELKTVVSFGVDYIQGYYTARPMFDIVNEINEKVRNEIIDFSREVAKLA